MSFFKHPILHLMRLFAMFMAYFAGLMQNVCFRKYLNGPIGTKRSRALMDLTNEWAGRSIHWRTLQRDVEWQIITAAVFKK